MRLLNVLQFSSSLRLLNRQRSLSMIASGGPFKPSLILLQKGGAGGKGKGGPAAPAAVAEVFDLSKVVPVNLLKEGPEPEIKPDSEYPPWVFTLTDERPILEDLVMKGLENVKPADMKRVFRLANKRRIKANNIATAKTS